MLFGPKHTFQDGNQWSYQIWPVQFVYGRTGHFEEFSIANTGSPLKKFNFQCTYFPGLYSYAVWTKTHLSRWESMVIPDLTCTVRVRPHRSLLLCCSDQNTPFKWESHTRAKFVYGRTLWRIANVGPPLKKFNFQCTYFPGLYSYAVWTKTHLSRWESMVIPDLTCTVLVRPHRSLLKNLHS